jgi:DNA processing protein
VPAVSDLLWQRAEAGFAMESETGHPVAREDDALALLTLLALPGVGPATTNKAVARARTRGLSVGEILDHHEDFLRLSADQLRKVETARARARDLSAAVAEHHAALVPITGDDYPGMLKRRLGDSAPPVLTIMGNERLLDEPAVGFCGSRAAREKGLAVTGDTATQLAEAGLGVVSGCATGVDMAAHKAALGAGGSTTLVLAEGFLHFSVKREIRDLWDLGRIAVVSQFVPDSVWSVHNAMRRNRTICGLSRALVLIEAREKGGSFEAGKTALELGMPLFAAVYEGMPESAAGNRDLLKAGARALLKSRSSGRANIAPIIEAVGADTGAIADAVPARAF